VKWHRGITGDQILNEVAAVTYRQSDGLIVQIDGTPKSGTADDTHYWSYWHDVNGQWRYSSSGASSYQPAAGTVEGWAYDNGAAQPPKPNAHPAGLYRAICGTADQPAAPSPTPTRTRSAAAHHVRPSAVHPSTPSPTVNRHPARHRKAAHSHPTAGRQHHRSSASRSAPAVAPTSSSSSPARTPHPRLLAKPAAQPTTRGSAVPSIVALGLVIVLLGGGAALALWRRRAG
jgi:hypothetical protein